MGIKHLITITFQIYYKISYFKQVHEMWLTNSEYMALKLYKDQFLRFLDRVSEEAAAEAVMDSVDRWCLSQEDSPFRWWRPSPSL